MNDEFGMRRYELTVPSMALRSMGFNISDDAGKMVFEVQSDGTSFHAQEGTFGGGIKSEEALIFEDAIRRYGAIIPLPPGADADLEAEGVWRFGQRPLFPGTDFYGPTGALIGGITPVQLPGNPLPSLSTFGPWSFSGLLSASNQSGRSIQASPRASSVMLPL